MSKHIETIMDGRGKVYASWLTPRERQRWVKTNLPLISHLQWIYIMRGENKHAIHLDKNKYMWSLNHF